MGKRRREEPPRSPGRPRKSADEQRSDVIGVRVSPKEKAIIEKHADGRELSAFLRQAGMGQQQPARVPLANREISGHLSSIGNNLNQLVRLAHVGRCPDHLEAFLRRMYDLIVKWRRELLGEPNDCKNSSR
jgi:hypothetical protein